jgi:hypothetical protein
VLEHARIAGQFRGKRHVSALPLVGFKRGESLPATAEAAARVIAESVLEASEGEPFVLVGHSSGGALALSVTTVLEHTWGIKPDAVIMLDTLSLRHETSEKMDTHAFGKHYTTQAQDKSAGVKLDSARVTAMGHWFKMMKDLVVYPSTVPSLLIRCTVMVGSLQPVEEGVVPADTVRLIEADHFSMVTTDSAQTDEIMEEWLGTLAAGTTSAEEAAVATSTD